MRGAGRRVEDEGLRGARRLPHLGDAAAWVRVPALLGMVASSPHSTLKNVALTLSLLAVSTASIAGCPGCESVDACVYNEGEWGPTCSQERGRTNLCANGGATTLHEGESCADVGFPYQCHEDEYLSTSEAAQACNARKAQEEASAGGSSGSSGGGSNGGGSNGGGTCTSSDTVDWATKWLFSRGDKAVQFKLGLREMREKTAVFCIKYQVNSKDRIYTPNSKGYHVFEWASVPNRPDLDYQYAVKFAAGYVDTEWVMPRELLYDFSDGNSSWDANVGGVVNGGARDPYFPSSCADDNSVLPQSRCKTGKFTPEDCYLAGNDTPSSSYCP